MKGRDVVSLEFENSAGRDSEEGQRKASLRQTLWSACSQRERRGERHNTGGDDFPEREVVEDGEGRMKRTKTTWGFHQGGD